MVCGRQGFRGGTVEIEEDDAVVAGMEPRTGAIEREFRTDGPEAPERLRIQECDAFRHLVRVEEGVGKASVCRR